MISDPSHAVMLQYPTITSTKVRKKIMEVTLLGGSEIPNNHLGCVKPCISWDMYHINWLAGFLNHQQ